MNGIIKFIFLYVYYRFILLQLLYVYINKYRGIYYALYCRDTKEPSKFSIKY